nr:mas-related G-protein coupled receptor member A6-like [Pogona vitticeps]
MFIFWIGFWGLLQLPEAHLVPPVFSNWSVTKEESFLPSLKKALFGKDEYLREDDFNLTRQNATFFPPVELNISRRICCGCEHIIEFLGWVLQDHITVARFAVSVFTAGLFVNLIIFFFLLFHLQRKSWTVYIWNLAVADLAVFLFLCVIRLFTSINNIYGDASEAFDKLFLPLAYLFLALQGVSVHFLVAVASDWYLFLILSRNRHSLLDYLRPLFSVLDAVILWALSCHLMLFFNLGSDTQPIGFVSLMVFAPLIVICTQTLILQIWCKLRGEGNLHTEIVLGAFFCLATWAPLHLFSTMSYDCATLSLLAFQLTILSSAINPILYIFIGRGLLHHPENVRLPHVV